MATFELSTKKYKSGRRPFTAVLYELQPPECVVDDIGTQYNKNGITFLEEYAKSALDSITDMNVRAAFIDDDRTIVSGHGETGVEDGMPVFRNACTIGHCTKGYIDDVDIDGVTKRCVCAKGYLDEMCYPDFVASLENDLNNGINVEGSIEIYKTEDNDAIVYKSGWHDKGRIPTEYIHSGWDIVANPADPSSTLLELNNTKKEEQNMEFNMDEVKSVIKSTMAEINSNEEAHANEIQKLNNQISELNSQLEAKNSVIEEKEKAISELNASAADMQKLLDQMKADQQTYWEEREILEKEIAKAKVAEKLAELDATLGEFNEDEKAVAKDDIEALRNQINACKKKDELNNVTSEINAIKSKICMAIVDAQKAKAAEESKISEQNSYEEKIDIEDIFAEMCSEKVVENDDDDLNIF